MRVATVALVLALSLTVQAKKGAAGAGKDVPVKEAVPTKKAETKSEGKKTKPTAEGKKASTEAPKDAKKPATEGKKADKKKASTKKAAATPSAADEAAKLADLETLEAELAAKEKELERPEDQDVKAHVNVDPHPPQADELAEAADRHLSAKAMPMQDRKSENVRDAEAAEKERIEIQRQEDERQRRVLEDDKKFHRINANRAKFEQGQRDADADHATWMMAQNAKLAESHAVIQKMQDVAHSVYTDNIPTATTEEQASKLAEHKAKADAIFDEVTSFCTEWKRNQGEHTDKAHEIERDIERHHVGTVAHLDNEIDRAEHESVGIGMVRQVRRHKDMAQTAETMQTMCGEAEKMREYLTSVLEQERQRGQERAAADRFEKAEAEKLIRAQAARAKQKREREEAEATQRIAEEKRAAADAKFKADEAKKADNSDM